MNITKDKIKQTLKKNISKVMKEYKDPSSAEGYEAKHDPDSIEYVAKKRRKDPTHGGKGMRGVGKAGSAVAPVSKKKLAGGADDATAMARAAAAAARAGSAQPPLDVPAPKDRSLSKLIGKPGEYDALAGKPKKQKYLPPTWVTAGEKGPPKKNKKAKLIVRKWSKKRDRILPQLDYYKQALEAGDQTAQYSINILQKKLKDINRVIQHWSKSHEERTRKSPSMLPDKHTSTQSRKPKSEREAEAPALGAWDLGPKGKKPTRLGKIIGGHEAERVAKAAPKRAPWDKPRPTQTADVSKPDIKRDQRTKRSKKAGAGGPTETKITEKYIKNFVKDELLEGALLNVPGVDSMPPGEEFVGPSLGARTVEDRLTRLEDAVFGALTGHKVPDVAGHKKINLKELYQQWKRQEEKVKLHDRVNPEQVEELAKELALQAGEEDEITYDWKDFVDDAKDQLFNQDSDRIGESPTLRSARSGPPEERTGWDDFIDTLKHGDRPPYRDTRALDPRGHWRGVDKPRFDRREKYTEPLMRVSPGTGGDIMPDVEFPRIRRWWRAKKAREAKEAAAASALNAMAHAKRMADKTAKRRPAIPPDVFKRIESNREKEKWEKEWLDLMTQDVPYDIGVKDTDKTKPRPRTFIDRHGKITHDPGYRTGLSVGRPRKTHGSWDDAILGQPKDDPRAKRPAPHGVPLGAGGTTSPHPPVPLHPPPPQTGMTPKQRAQVKRDLDPTGWASYDWLDDWLDK